jgi:hypothetical protein
MIKLNDPHIENVDTNDPLFAAYVCGLSGNFDNLSKLNIFENYEKICFNNDNQEFYLGFFAIKNNIGIISFKGSSSVTEIIQNFQFKLVPFVGESKVHFGYYSYFLNVIDLIESFIDKHKINKLIVTGHSLGGCLGMITAVYLSLNTDLDITLHTYNQLRTGDENFCKLIEKCSFKKSIIKNFNDEITNLCFDDDYEEIATDTICYGTPLYFERTVFNIVYNWRNIYTNHCFDVFYREYKKHLELDK